MHGGKCMGSKLSWWLLVIGGLNWGLVGLGGFLGRDLNVVHLVFGSVDWLEWLVYLLVGVAAVMGCFHCKCKKCTAGGCGGACKCGSGEEMK